MKPRRARAAASVTMRAGSRLSIDARVTTAGLLSIGALVSSILLSSAVIVLAAGRVARDRARAIPSAGADRTD